MSWHRDYLFYLANNNNQEFVWVDDDNLTFNFCSRSDYFGQVLEEILDEFNDLVALRFFKVPDRYDCDLDLSEEVLSTRLVIFDREKQVQVINNIERIFEYAHTAPKIFEEIVYEETSDSLPDQLKLADEIQSKGKLSLDNDSFPEMLATLLLLKRFFQQAIEQNLFVKYVSFIP